MYWILPPSTPCFDRHFPQQSYFHFGFPQVYIWISPLLPCVIIPQEDGYKICWHHKVEVNGDGSQFLGDMLTCDLHTFLYRQNTFVLMMSNLTTIRRMNKWRGIDVHHGCIPRQLCSHCVIQNFTWLDYFLLMTIEYCWIRNAYGKPIHLESLLVWHHILHFVLFPDR